MTLQGGAFVQELLLWINISIIYSECIYVALGIRHEKRMRRVILSSVAYLDVQYFCTLSRKRHDSGYRCY